MVIWWVGGGGWGLVSTALCALLDEGFSQICIAFFRIIISPPPHTHTLKKQLRLFLWL